MLSAIAAATLSRKLCLAAVLLASAFLLAACPSPSPPVPPDPQAALIAKGRALFFNETFGGNGRTCGTCHRAENNVTIDPAFIATLPKDDPLFVAEFNPALREHFEQPRLMREFGLILENLDGFDDLANKFTMRGVPHTLALRTSVQSAQGPRTRWSGDGAPADGSLRAFAVGAVIQHFTKTLVNGALTQTWFVGEDPVNDVLGAAAMGLRAIWLSGVRPWPIDRPASPWQIAALGEIVALVHSEHKYAT